MSDVIPARTEDRYWASVHPFVALDACWLWIGKNDNKGYGEFRFKVNGQTYFRRAHRVAYELLIGPIPDGLVIDHLCRNTMCVNPDHLEPVTVAVNCQRGRAGRDRPYGGLVCRNGHALTDGNTIIDFRGYSQCRICTRERMARWLAKRAA